MKPARQLQHDAAEDLPRVLRRGAKGFKAALQDWLKEDLESRLEGLDVGALSVLAASPIWNYAAAETVWFTGFLDRAVQADWVETGGDLPASCLQLTLRPTARNVAPPPLQVLESIGLLSEESAEAAEISPTTPLSTPISIDANRPGTVLRARGCRLISPEPLPPHTSVELLAQWTEPTSTMQTTLVGTVVRCRPHPDGDWAVVIGFGMEEAPTPGTWSRRLYQVFTMPRSKRAELLQHLTRQRESRLRSHCAEAANQLAQRFPSGEGLPTSLADWVLVARELNSTEEAAAMRLRAEVESRLRSGRTGEALQLLQTAQLLADALGGSVSTGSRLLQRQLEQEYRRAMDERYLSGFLKRHEQIAACEELLAPGNRSWALHLLGIGGMGKTMLIRYLAARLAPERGLLVSRVDFDYLTPDYPVRRPGQLLLALADGLLAYGTGHRFESVLKEFQARTLKLHGQLDAQPSPGNPLENLHRPAFEELLSAFADLIRVLPLKPVLFILDTCEELAKLQPDGAFLPGVEATFEILQRLQANLARDHSDFPVRVIFAGRRLLSPRGDGWRADGPFTGTPRPYLRLHEIRGFDEAEARHFLQSCKRPEPKLGRSPMSDGMVRAILVRSEERPLGQRREQHRVVHDTPEPQHSSIRYNPFKLNLYADWWLADEQVNEDRLSRDPTDPYIEHRIVRRLQPSVREILPHLVLVRRWDEPLLERLFARGAEATANLYRELSLLEWTEFKPHVRPAYGINDHHLPGLETYVNAPGRAELTGIVREILGRTLADFIRHTPLRDVVPEYFDAALALLPAAEAAKLWEEVNRRIVTETDWKWTQDVTGLLLGERGRVPTSLRAMVHVTQLAALRHTQADFDAFERWREVEELAPHHPDRGTAASLRRQALAFQITSRASRGIKPDGELLARFWSMVSAWVASAEPPDEGSDPERRSAEDGAIAHAIEALVELTESSRAEGILAGPAIKAWCDQKRGPVPRLFARALRAQAMRQGEAEASKSVTELIQQAQTGDAELKAAVDELAEIPSTEFRRSFPTWPTMSNLPARLRLAWLGEASGPKWASETRSQDLRRWRDEAMEQLPDADADRLLSVMLQRQLDSETIPKLELEAVEAAASKAPPEPPKRRLHRKVDSLAVTLAWAYAVLGFPRKGLAILEPIVRSSVPEPSALIMRAKIIRKFRLTEPSLSAESAAQLQEPEMLGGWYAELALCGAQPHRALPDPSTLAASSLPRWWRAYGPAVPETLDKPMRDAAERIKIKYLNIDLGGYGVLLEADRIAPGDGWLKTPRGELTLPRVPSTQDLGSDLRVLALNHGPLDASDIPDRATAELALEEASLMAMRLPKLAVERLFAPALDRFQQASDPVGVFQSSVGALVACIRNGKLRVAQKWLEEHVKPAYQNLRATFPAWPPWPDGVEIDAIWESPTFSSWKHDPDGSEWLKRLFTAMKFLQDDRLHKVEPWQAWSAKHLGTAIPVELNLLRPDLAGRSWRGFILNGIYGAIGISIAVAVWYFIFRLFSSGWERWISADSSLWVRVPAFLVTIGAAVAVASWLLPRLKHFPSLAELGTALFGMIVIRLSLRTPQGTTSGVWARMNARYSFLGRLGTRLFGAFLARTLGSYPFELLGEGIQWSPTTLQRGLKPDSAPGPIGERLTKTHAALKQVIRWFTPKRQPLEIEADALNQSFSWESALFAEMNPGVTDAPLDHFCMYRIGATASVRARKPEEELNREIQFYGPRTWWESAKSSWTRGRRQALRGAPWREPEWVINTQSASSTSPSQTFSLVKHLIGRAHPSAGTLAFVLDEFGSLNPLPTSAGLVILQGEPIVSEQMQFPDWTETERAAAQQLRALAAETFAQGAWAVLMIPSLPSQVASDVIVQIGADLGFRRRPSTGQLRRVLTNVRIVIDRAGREENVPPSLAQREAALSVTLFARSD